MPVSPVLRYLGKWLVLASAVGLLAGSTSAALMMALDWATATRNAHHELIALLPLAGLAAGWTYLRMGSGTNVGKASRSGVGIKAGSQLLVDEIHRPSQPVLLRMAPLIFLATALARLIFGLAGRLFIACTHALSARMKRHIRYAPLRPLLGGCAIAVAVLATDAWQFVGLDIPTMLDAFTQPLPWWNSAVKAALTVASIGSGFKGGEVTPLFFIGATLANSLAPLLHLAVDLLTALVLVAVFAGAAQTPVACIVMAVELFGAPIGTYPTVACGMSFLAAGRQGLYRPSAFIATSATAQTQAKTGADACSPACAAAATDADVCRAVAGCVAGADDGNGDGNSDCSCNGNANG